MRDERVGVYVPVSAVFPGTSSDFNTFKATVESLSRTDALFWCARLNRIVTGLQKLDRVGRQIFGLQQFLTEDEIGSVNQYVAKNGGVGKVIVFFRGQILELLRWIALFCEDHPDDGKTFDDPEVRRNFAKALLIASDVWSQRLYASRMSMRDGLETGRLRALGSIRKGIEDNLRAPDLSRSLGRGQQLFREYFPRCCPDFETEFRSAMGLSVEEYFACLSMILIQFMNEATSEPGLLNLNQIRALKPYGDVFRSYFEVDSLAIDDLRDALWGVDKASISGYADAQEYDYRLLREKPILAARDGRAIVVDPLLYSEKAMVGPVFSLLKKETSSERANEVFGAFGDAYEEYTSGILTRMYPETEGSLAKRLSCNLVVEKGDDSRGTLEIDACLNDVGSVVLFETKAVWIREDKIIMEDYRQYLEHLLRKYGATEGNERDRRVRGLGQIARFIGVLGQSEWRERNGAFKSAQVVYPVLLVHDRLLAAPVHGSIMEREFRKVLEPDEVLPSGELRKGLVRVVPLVVMTVEDLENLETSVEHFALLDLLADYSSAHPDRDMSLGDFIASSKYGKMLYHSRSLASAAMDAVIAGARAVFPELADELLEK